MGNIPIGIMFTANTRRFMGKLITWFFLIILVVIVPLGSWFYLKEGLDYRKGALLELTPKDSIPRDSDSLQIIFGKTSIIVIDSLVKNDIIEKIREQFKNTPGFQVSFISENSTSALPAEYLKDVWVRYAGNSFVLIDTAGNIRNAYKNDSLSIKKLVEHTAIVIPRPKESDIKMKNEQ